jgi:hypothetical protein
LSHSEFELHNSGEDHAFLQPFRCALIGAETSARAAISVDVLLPGVSAHAWSFDEQ